MGLLDDAIREHLELKRLRGADPGEVARAQMEALDPVPRDLNPAAELSEETAELDMRTLLSENEGTASEVHSGDDGMEWEAPHESADNVDRGEGPRSYAPDDDPSAAAGESPT